MVRISSKLFSVPLICFFLSILIIVPDAFALIGNDDAMNWYGVSAQARIFESTGVTVLDEDRRMGTQNEYANAFSSNVWFDDGLEPMEVGFADLLGEAEPYILRGSVDGLFFDEPYISENKWSAGGFFRDEIYFQTIDSSPAYMEFDFNVQVSFDTNTFDPGREVSFTTQWINFHNDPLNSWEFLDSLTLEIKDNGSGYEFIESREDGTINTYSLGGDPFYDYNEIVTFSTAAVLGNGGLIGSDSYFANSINAWAYANEGIVDFMSTLELVDVRLYDESGTPLHSDEYTLSSSADNFASFNNTAVVPEPVSSTLFIIGGATFGLRRFWKGRRTA